MTPTLRCRCPWGTPPEPEAHGLAPAGWKRPGHPDDGAAYDDCVLCGNSGVTTPERVRAARAGGALLATGWTAMAAALVLVLARIAGVGSLGVVAFVGIAALLLLSAGRAVERGLARSG